MKFTRAASFCSLALLLLPACPTDVSPSSEAAANHEAPENTQAEEKTKPTDQVAAADPKAEKPAPFVPRGKQVPAPPDVAAAPTDATVTASGLAYKVLTKGEGTTSPGANDTVKVLVTGWTPEGVTFDTTEGTDRARSVPVSKAIPGWAEAFALMHAGDKVRVWIPEALAYKGMRGRPSGPVVYDIELQEILAAPETPGDVAAPPADAKKTASGLAYKILNSGSGDEHPRPWDRVTVNYSGWTTDGKMFDSSVMRGAPATFGLQQVIAGWTEGIPLLAKGSKARLWIPEELAYQGQPGKPAGMLVFDVELLEIQKMPEPPKAPANVAAPPQDAQKTASGLAYKVLTKGSGTVHPTPTSRVTVHYSGWTTDGKMFDSSVTRNRPATFGLNQVIKGWTEGVALMVQGEKTRFWIPEALAYQGQPGKPAGMLVFDVELIAIE